VQYAVDQASPGEEIRVAGGVYSDIHVREGITQVVYISRSVTIRGGYTTTNWTTPDPSVNPTTLDAGGQGRVMVITGTIAPTVAGLRMTGGDAGGLGGSPWGEDAGGGVYIHSATAVISGSLIYSNSTDEIGGGLYLLESPSQVAHNIISGNAGPASGGGLYLSQSPATIIGNIITGNTATPFGYGGGMFFRDSDGSVLTGNTFSGNSAGNNGGGLSLRDSDAVLSGNIISGNSAGSDGGGVELYFNDASLSGNMVTGNTAYSWGGGMFLYGGSPTLVNTVVADNALTGEGAGQGAGIHVRYGSPRLLHTTVARNKGGDGSGFYVTDAGFPFWASSVAMTNTIIVGQSIGITVTVDNAATLDATLWHANSTDWGGAGTIDRISDQFGDPAFAADGYHLTGNSAAIDAGVDAGVEADIDGDPRPLSGGYDIGADEFSWLIYLPLVARNR
jgi:parallel beta-helix repeat protein